MTHTLNMEKEKTKSNREGDTPFMYSIVGTIGTNEVVEIQKIDMKTKRKVVVFQNKDYKKLIDKLQK